MITPDGSDERDHTVETGQPTAIVADIRHPGLRREAPGERVDGLLRRPQVRTQPDVDRGRKRIALEPAGSGAQIREVAAEALGGPLLRDQLPAGADAALIDPRLHRLELRRRDVVAQVDGELRRFAPPLGQAADVGVDDQEEAEHEEPGADRQDRQNRGAAAAPQAGGGLGHEILQRAHQVISTMRPCSSVSERRPTRRISSRSWVATSTVVPRAFTSRSRFMISRERSGIEVAGRFVGQDDDRIVDQRPRNRDALLLATGQLLRERVHAVLKADPLQHLERLALLLRERHAEDPRHQRDVLDHRLARQQLEVLEDEAERAAVRLDLAGRERGEVAAADNQLAFRRHVLPQQQPEQRGLAGAARPGEEHELAFVDAQGEVAQRIDATPVQLGDPLGFDHSG